MVAPPVFRCVSSVRCLSCTLRGLTGNDQLTTLCLPNFKHPLAV